jgi:methionyl-tRNA formyltransferase
MGTGEIGVPTLRWLAGSGHELVGVYTQPAKPVGRKSIMTDPPIKLAALALGLPVYQPARLRTPEVVAQLRALAPDLIVVMAYGQILPIGVLEAPRIACLNLHASILPKYRGAAPIQAAILAGERETGITLMYMDEGLDTGDILLVEALPIASDETGGSLHDRLAELGPVVLARGLQALEGGSAPRSPQDDSLATHVGKLSRDDGRIDWSRPAAEIERRIRAYDPWPGTMTSILGAAAAGGAPSRPKILKVLPPCPLEEIASHGQVPGAILEANKRGILVATGDARIGLRLQRVQPESKNVMTAAAFLSGRPFGEGARLA